MAFAQTTNIPIGSLGYAPAYGETWPSAKTNLSKPATLELPRRSIVTILTFRNVTPGNVTMQSFLIIGYHNWKTQSGDGLCRWKRRRIRVPILRLVRALRSSLLELTIGHCGNSTCRRKSGGLASGHLVSFPQQRFLGARIMINQRRPRRCPCVRVMVLGVLTFQLARLTVADDAGDPQPAGYRRPDQGTAQRSGGHDRSRYRATLGRGQRSPPRRVVPRSRPASSGRSIVTSGSSGCGDRWATTRRRPPS